MSTNAKYMCKQISEQLKGGTILEAICDDSEGFGFRVKKGTKEFNVWVDCDPEGNGPGWLQIELDS